VPGRNTVNRDKSIGQYGLEVAIITADLPNTKEENQPQHHDVGCRSHVPLGMAMTATTEGD
jgi:hypothetical protein